MRKLKIIWDILVYLSTIGCILFSIKDANYFAACGWVVALLYLTVLDLREYLEPKIKENETN